jgi:arsenate reductase (thioredoxin)
LTEAEDGRRLTEAPVITVVFACVHNAGRSQMAAALFNAFADPGTARAISAGTHPADHVHPEVIQVMHELGIDLRAATPRKMTSEITQDADWLITMGCGEECPVIPGVRRDDWPIEDPKGKPLVEVRRIREEIELRVRTLLWLLNA